MRHLKALSGILAKKFGQKIFSEKFKNDRQVLLRGRLCYCVNFLFELLDKSNFATNTHGELTCVQCVLAILHPVIILTFLMTAHV